MRLPRRRRNGRWLAELDWERSTLKDGVVVTEVRRLPWTLGGLEPEDSVDVTERGWVRRLVEKLRP